MTILSGILPGRSRLGSGGGTRGRYGDSGIECHQGDHAGRAPIRGSRRWNDRRYPGAAGGRGPGRQRRRGHRFSACWNLPVIRRAAFAAPHAVARRRCWVDPFASDPRHPIPAGPARPANRRNPAAKDHDHDPQRRHRTSVRGGKHRPGALDRRLEPLPHRIVRQCLRADRQHRPLPIGTRAFRTLHALGSSPPPGRHARLGVPLRVHSVFEYEPRPDGRLRTGRFRIPSSIGRLWFAGHHVPKRTNHRGPSGLASRFRRSARRRNPPR